jgi:hypothetical protein
VPQNQGQPETNSAAAVAVQAAHGWKSLGSVSIALGRAQFGAQSFFQLFKNCSNFAIQICCHSEIQKMSKLGMVLELIILNNFSHWVDFQILLDFELENLETIQI